MSDISKDEIVMQLTLKVLENFKYDAHNFGGTALKEHAEINAELATDIYNKIHEKILNIDASNF